MATKKRTTVKKQTPLEKVTHGFKFKAASKGKAKAAVQRMRSWSPSSFGLWSKCPARAKYKHLDKLPDPSGEAMERGNIIHKAAEQYITGRTDTLHEFLRVPGTKKELVRLRKLYKEKRVRVEMELAFASDWTKRPWFGDETWLRLKVDALVLPAKPGGWVEVIDWKTGKLKEYSDRPNAKPHERDLLIEYQNQLNLYSTGAMSLNLGEMADSKLFFTDFGKEVKLPDGQVTQETVKAAQAKWSSKVAPMFNDTVFPPRPGNGCTYCPYSTNRDGPCPY